MQVEFSERAFRQLETFGAYYHGISPEVGYSFEDALEYALTSLAQFHKTEIKYDSIRTYRVRPFHVRLHYRADEALSLITIDGVFDERGLGSI